MNILKDALKVGEEAAASFKRPGIANPNVNKAQKERP